MLILASGNWVVNNLENAIDTWNDKLSEIWQIITQSPEAFKGGTIWQVILKINGAVQAIGLALLVLFFVIGVVKTCSSLTDVKKPEHAIKLFVRFAIATITVDYDAINYDFNDIEVVANNYDVISSEDMESYLNRKKGNDKNEEKK